MKGILSLLVIIAILTLLSCATTGVQDVDITPKNPLVLEKFSPRKMGNLKLVHSGYSIVIDNNKKALLILFRLEIGDISRERVWNRKFGMSADIYTPSSDIDRWDLTVVRRPDKTKGKNSSGSRVDKVVDKNKLPYPFFLLSDEELSQIEFFNVYDNDSKSIYLHAIDPTSRYSRARLISLLVHLSALVNGLEI